MRSLKMFPNCSIINATNGFYYGTISTPTNMELVKILLNKNWGAFIYNDPIEYRQSATPTRGPSPLHGKRGIVPKITKPVVGNNKKAKVVARVNKKSLEEAKETEQEPSVIIKRHIIGIINFEDVIDNFNQTHDAMEKEKIKRRELIKAMMAQPLNYEEEEEEVDEVVDESIVNTSNNIILRLMKNPQ